MCARGEEKEAKNRDEDNAREREELGAKVRNEAIEKERQREGERDAHGEMNDQSSKLMQRILKWHRKFALYTNTIETMKNVCRSFNRCLSP